MTRREIIKTWNEQSDSMLDSQCCPYCKDILTNSGAYLMCENVKCFTVEYYLDTGEKISYERARQLDIDEL